MLPVNGGGQEDVGSIERATKGSCIITGLFIEGARWDDESRRLVGLYNIIHRGMILVHKNIISTNVVTFAIKTEPGFSLDPIFSPFLKENSEIISDHGKTNENIII